MNNWEDKWNELIIESTLPEGVEAKDMVDEIRFILNTLEKELEDIVTESDPRRLQHLRSIMVKAHDSLRSYGKKPNTTMSDLGPLQDL